MFEGKQFYEKKLKALFGEFYERNKEEHVLQGTPLTKLLVNFEFYLFNRYKVNYFVLLLSGLL